MDIQKITVDKKRFLDLLLLADEQEDMIDRYLERGSLYALYDKGVLRSTAVVTPEAEGICELKSLATAPAHQRMGYAEKLVEALCTRYAETHRVMLVGTGDVPSILTFYMRCGFSYSHRILNFFTEHYDHPIIEEGVLLRDMVYLAKKL